MDRIPRDCRQAFCAAIAARYGSGDARSRAERASLSVQASADRNVKKQIKKTFSKDDWTAAGQGWQGRTDTLRLEGWSRSARWPLRRRLKEGLAVSGRDDAGQLALGFVEIGAQARSTKRRAGHLARRGGSNARPALSRPGRQRKSLRRTEEPVGLGRLHHPRSRPLRTMARFIALIYNWWNLFVRLAEPDKHLEAITAGPLLSAIAERSRHARQTTLRVASSHAKAGWAASVLSGIARSYASWPICGAVDGGSALAPDSRPRCPILARRAPAASSAAPDGPA